METRSGHPELLERPGGLAAGALVDGRYRLHERIDSGGMGVVHRAVDERLERIVAVKLLHTFDERAVHRLETEAILLARLDQQNIVRIFDVGWDEGRCYIVTEYVPGPSLEAILRTGPLAANDTATIGVAIGRALEASHRAGVVHRDVKPGNIVVTTDGEPRLLDYGIARAGDLPTLTFDGAVVGTPRYLSPEQAVGLNAEAGSDVYSLGLVLIECLTGRPAFGGTVAETLAARLSCDPAVPAELGLPWRDLLVAATARRVNDRPSAGELAEGLVPASVGSHLDRTVAALAPTAPRPLVRHPATITPAATLAADPLAVTRVHPRTRADEEAVHRRRWPVRVALAAMLVAALLLARDVETGRDQAARSTEPPTTAATVPSTTVPPTSVAPTVPSTLAPVGPPASVAPHPRRHRKRDQGDGGP